MGTPEKYEQLRVQAIDSSNQWDDLDFATGFLAELEACDADGDFLPWDRLPESVQATVMERLKTWA